MRFEIYIKEPKKPDRFYTQAMDEYKKRLTGDCKLQYHFIRREKDWEKILSQAGDEKNLLIKIVPGKAEVTSELFADWIGEWERTGAKSLYFMIEPEREGEGSLTGSEETFECLSGNSEFHAGEKYVLSLSCFAMPASMSAMILLEQIYRGYRIRNNQPYHK